jgi:uncharacterized protein (TIGR03435 family)
LQNVNIVDLIHTAYGVDPERVYGGPNWLEIERLDVIAKTPSGSTAESRKLMLQALLADRFKLVFHNDSKPMPAYGLTVEKNAKLQEASGTGEPGCNFKMESGPQQPQQAPTPGGPPPSFTMPVLSYTCHNTTMAAFAANIPSIPAGPRLDNKPVVDQTGLKGVYDFSFRYTPTIPPGANITVTGQQQPFADVMEKELGLKLQLTTAPLPVITVDSAQMPTPNSPDVAKAFPPPPTEFDVAEIKPSPAPVGGGRGGTMTMPEIKNGRVIVPGITLQNLITVAWNLNGPDELIGAPKWLNSDRFDLIAKAPAGVALGDLMVQNNRSMPINLKALAPMIRSLLVERFKLTVHTEQRPVEAYSLVAVKPKLQKSDPAARTRWNEGPAPDGKDPRKTNPILGRLVTCQNVTMAQFAELLPGIAPGYIHNEVLDKTGLEGGWDFTLSFSGNGFQTVGGGGRGGDSAAAAPSGTAAEASDPSGGLSLLDALQKQVGLKLEMQKRPFPVLVIDHIEQKPTDN